MRPFVRVKMLNSGDYKQRRDLAKSRKLAAGKVKRAKIVLLSNQGFTAREIAAKLDCNERTALRWINCFNKYGIAGLEEGPREGRPRVFGPEDVGSVIQAALTPPRDLGLPFASWTLGRLVVYLSEYKGGRHGSHQNSGGALPGGVEMAQAGGMVRREGGSGVRRKKMT